MGRFLVLLAVISSVGFGLPDASMSSNDVDILRKLLVKGLGLKKIPKNADEANISPEVMAAKLEEYNKLVKESEMRRRAEAPSVSSRAFTLKPSGKGKTTKHSKKPNTNHLYFAIERKPGTVKQASLQIFAKRTSGKKAASVQLRVFQITDSDRKLIDRRQFEITDSGWIDLEVKRAVNAWMTGAEKNYGLDIECRRCLRKGVTLVMPNSVYHNVSSIPVINVVLKERGANSRQRRDYEDEAFHAEPSPPVECNNNNQVDCCRHEMEVKFHELPGFGFIVQPWGFDAGFCTGQCPSRHNPANHHALIQSLVHMQNQSLVPLLCCAPSKLEDIQILHIDEDDHTMLKVSSWKSMKVTECACN